MEHAGGLHKVPRLEGASNYEVWKTMAKMVLIRERLWTIVDGRDPEPTPLERTELETNEQLDEYERKYTTWTERNEQAYATLLLTVSSGTLVHVQNLTSAREIWLKLGELYSVRGYTARHLVLKDLMTTKLAGESSVGQYVDKLKSHGQKLLDMGHPVSPWILTSLLLHNLGETYEPFVASVLQTVRDQEPDFDTVVHQLVDEERRKQSSDSTTVLFSKAKPKAKGDNVSQKTCHHCKKGGHVQADCWKLHPEKQPRKGGKNPQPKRDSRPSKAESSVLMAMGQGTQPSGVWHVDSGATDHMCSLRSSFRSYKALVKKVYVADGNHTLARGIGSVDLQAILPDGTEMDLVVENVLHTPDLSANLLSVSTMTGKGITVTFGQNKCWIKKADGTALAYATRAGSLFNLHLKGRTVAAAATSTKATLETWHRRMAHLGKGNIQKLKDMSSGLELDETSQEDHGVCESCMLGKQTRTPSRDPQQRASGRLDLVHSDVGGPITPQSLGGARYYVTFTDDLTRATWVYTMKTKSECLSRFQEFYQMMKTEGLKVKRLRSDNGGEYNSKASHAMFKKNGIKWEPTVPYAPEQDGVSERVNRTLMERVRAVLADSGLEKGLWAEILSTVVHLKNRSPTTAVNNKTPYEAWYGKMPELGHVRVIGCTAYHHLPHSKKKLDNRSLKCQLLGYEGTHQYRLWDPVGARVIQSRDTVFDEYSAMDVPEGGAASEDAVGVPALIRKPDIPAVEDEEESIHVSSLNDSQIVVGDSPTMRRDQVETEGSTDELQDSTPPLLRMPAL